MAILNYEEDVRIDEQALELEWQDQAELAVRYGKEFSQMKKKVSELDEKVKVTRSELIRKAWDNPQKHLGQPKGAVQTVEAFYRSHKKHKEAKQNLIDAEEELSLVEIAYKEISYTRKLALENMVKLFASDYFAGPTVPRDLTKVRQERDKTRENANAGMKKMKRKKKKK